MMQILFTHIELLSVKHNTNGIAMLTYPAYMMFCNLFSKLGGSKYILRVCLILICLSTGKYIYIYIYYKKMDKRKIAILHIFIGYKFPFKLSRIIYKYNFLN